MYLLVPDDLFGPRCWSDLELSLSMVNIVPQVWCEDEGGNLPVPLDDHGVRGWIGLGGISCSSCPACWHGKCSEARYFVFLVYTTVEGALFEPATGEDCLGLPPKCQCNSWCPFPSQGSGLLGILRVRVGINRDIQLALRTDLVPIGQI